MARIKYVRAYHGIQPGTVVDEPRVNIVGELTRTEERDPVTKNMVPIQPYAVKVPDGTPTTQERERAESKTNEPERAETVKVSIPNKK